MLAIDLTTAWLHVCILFTLLILLFHFVITRITKSHVDKMLKSLARSVVREHVPKDGGRVNSVALAIMGSKEARRVRASVPQQSEIITLNNNWVLSYMTTTCILYWFKLIFVAGIVYFTFNINLIPLAVITSTLLIFLFIGIIEYMFFTKVAFRYVPATKADMQDEFIRGFSSQFAPSTR